MRALRPLEHRLLRARLKVSLVAALLIAALLSAIPMGNIALAAPEDAGVEAPDVSVFVNGTMMNFDVFPRIAKDRVLVPFRAIFEELGAEVEWIEAERRIVARKDWLTVDLKIGEPQATLNSEITQTMDVAPVIVNGRTLVPLRFVGESLGAKVDWEDTTRTVRITMPNESDAETALAHPHATVSDASGDFLEAPEGAPQGGVFIFPPVDIAKVFVASDSENLYVKVLFNGVIPSAPVTAEGFNQVNGLKVRVAVNTDTNAETGVAADKGAEAVLTYNVNLDANRETVSYFSGVAQDGVAATPTGTAFGNKAERMYAKHTIGRLVGGGMGYGYVTMAFWLKDLGISRPSEFDIYATAAACTPNWSAFSFDEAPNHEQREAYRITLPH